MTPTVNLEQMADALRVSRPTMRELLKRYPDLPVVERGRNGVPWQFNKSEVIAFIVAKRAEEAAAGAAKDEYLAQISLPLEGVIAPEDRALSAGDRLKNAQAMLKEDQVARERGFLVLKTEMRAALNEIWSPLNQALQAMPGTLARRHNLPDQVARDMRNFISTEQRELHRRLTALLGADALPPPEDVEDAQAA
ncbi:hypothetical protein ACVFYP_22320 [Roseomonas sp. F4]